MAWNGSAGTVEPKAPPKKAVKVSAIHGIIALVAVLVAGAVVYFSIHTKEEKKAPEQTPTPTGLIEEVAPAVVTNVVEEEKGVRYTKKGIKIQVPKNPWGTPIPEDLEYKPHWEYTTEDYARIDPGYAKRHQRFLERRAKNPWATGVDSRLSAMIFSEPGSRSMIIPFRKGFEKQFLKSLETPTLITKDDSPELREKKQALNETKMWLKDQMDAGKDIVEVLNDAVKKQEELRGLHDNLVRELRKMEREAASPEDIDLYVEAANKMLAEQGAGPISYSKTGAKLKVARRLIREGKEQGNE